jgi:hypothetical protein
MTVFCVAVTRAPAVTVCGLIARLAIFTTGNLWRGSRTYVANEEILSRAWLE